MTNRHKFLLFLVSLCAICYDGSCLCLKEKKDLLDEDSKLNIKYVKIVQILSLKLVP